MRSAEEILPIDLARAQLDWSYQSDPQQDAADRANLEAWRSQALAACEQIANRSIYGANEFTVGFLVDTVSTLLAWGTSEASDYPVCFVAYKPQAVRSVRYWSPTADWRQNPDQTITTFGAVQWGVNGRQYHYINPPAGGWPARLSTSTASTTTGLCYNQFVVEYESGIADADVPLVQRAALLLMADYAQGLPMRNKSAEALLSSLKPGLLADEPTGLARMSA